MNTDDASIRGLREAVRLSPDNVPLRQVLADALAAAGRHEEAIAEYQAALKRAPQNTQLKLALAATYFRQDKLSPALVIVEELLKTDPTPPAALVLHAKLLVRQGDIERAVRQYKRAIEEDPSVADPALGERLGVFPRGRSGDAFDEADEGGAPGAGRPGAGRSGAGGSDGPDDDESEIFEGRVRAGHGEGGASDAAARLERPTINFDDVGGMDELKEEIRIKIIAPLEHPELYQAYGKAIGGGILMYGPPGCGKTYLARATAGEVHARFLAIGINDVLEMWIGQSERNLHELFEAARNNTPCVLFFDEVDALGASRTDMRHSAGRQIINQFLSELDGVSRSNEGVLILAATNAPWHLDSAFRRPGRFDRILFVPPPDAPARASILQVMLKGKPVKDVDYHALAKKTDGFSGADIKAVVDVAVEAKLREAMKSGKPSPLNTGDLLAAARQLKPTTREWFATAKNYALYSNQGGVYDDILKHLKLL